MNGNGLDWWIGSWVVTFVAAWLLERFVRWLYAPPKAKRRWSPMARPGAWSSCLDCGEPYQAYWPQAMLDKLEPNDARLYCEDCLTRFMHGELPTNRHGMRIAG